MSSERRGRREGRREARRQEKRRRHTRRGGPEEEGGDCRNTQQGKDFWEKELERFSPSFPSQHNTVWNGILVWH